MRNTKRSRSRSRSHDKKKTSDYMDRNDIIESELGYTNVDNPYGDKNLSKKFVWKKKGEK